MKRLPPLFFLCPAVAALALLAAVGCKGGDDSTAAAKTSAAALSLSVDPITAVPDKDRYKVAADTTGFFRYSPLQASGSDMDLKKNARLTMLKRGRGFSQVKTADGQIGYVGTDDIAPLPPNEIAQEDAATLAAAQAAAGGQLAAPTTTATTVSNPSTAARNGKKTGAPMSSYHIPSSADADVRLPEPDTKPKPTPSPSPAVNFR